MPFSLESSPITRADFFIKGLASSTRLDAGSAAGEFGTDNFSAVASRRVILRQACPGREQTAEQAEATDAQMHD
jgi:hypothetical protein